MQPLQGAGLAVRQWQQATPQQGAAPRFCYSCGSAGHFDLECPTKKQWEVLIRNTIRSMHRRRSGWTRYEYERSLAEGPVARREGRKPVRRLGQHPSVGPRVERRCLQRQVDREVQIAQQHWGNRAESRDGPECPRRGVPTRTSASRPMNAQKDFWRKNICAKWTLQGCKNRFLLM